MKREVKVVPYNKDWPRLYQLEVVSLRTVLGDEIVSVHHIGSTAVPDLPAKPTIDILLEVPEDINNRWLIRQIKDLGYHFIPRPENPPPHMMFVKGYSEKGLGGVSYHMHIRHKGNWDELYFRDYLRKHPESAKEYAALKIKLAGIYRNDREAYTDGKTEFINRITALAKTKIQL